MVCEMTLPPWVPLFSIAGAIVSDVGGVLSHSAIVAREFDVPAVVGSQVGTTAIQTGQTITVDGTNGIVYLDGRSSSLRSGVSALTSARLRSELGTTRDRSRGLASSADIGASRSDLVATSRAAWRPVRRLAARAVNLGHTTVGCTSGVYDARDENPQSAPAITRSLPTRSA